VGGQRSTSFGLRSLGWIYRSVGTSSVDPGVIRGVLHGGSMSLV